MAVDESILSFGDENTLVGILTQPGGARGTDVGCLLLNVGVNPRSGPRRINVKTARRLAQSGVPSLRFDLSGLGDSRASSSSNNFRQQALVDLRAALDQFEASTGIRKFVVFGICSGAAHGMMIALDDARVVGLLQLDGYIFLTRSVRLERKLRRWAAFPFNPSLRRSVEAWNDWTAWLRAPMDGEARRLALAHLFGSTQAAATDDTGGFVQTDIPDYDAPTFTADMQKLVDRGVKLYLMYSATLNSFDHGFSLLKGLGRPPFLQHVRYEHLKDVDHTATTLAAQQKLLDLACSWIVEIAGLQRQAEPRSQAALALPSWGNVAAPANASSCNGPLPL
jgi:pimeloyl-ACP methyl ester carboxylesterase